MVSTIPGATSITLSWTQPSGGIVDSYTVQYSASVRGCSDVPPTQGGPTTISSTLRMYEITNLKEDSDISGTIAAVTGGSASTSFTTSTLTASNRKITTRFSWFYPSHPPIGPSRGPSEVTITAGVTSISIQWNEVDCVERNGVITSYRVRYGLSSSTSKETATVSGNEAGNRMFSTNRLLIRTSYSFEVAAVNGNGIGVYSTAVTGTTAVPAGAFNHSNNLSMYSYVCVLQVLDFI